MLTAFLASPAPIDRLAIDTAAFVLGLRARGLRDTAVLGAMERVPRPLFAPRRFADLARTDVGLPLACGQTMTAPSVVATMLVALDVGSGQRVLEIGTGSGYVTALLAHLGGEVVSIERFSTLAAEARTRLGVLGAAEGIVQRVGDGLSVSVGEERFDRILVNGAVAAVPAVLTSLLAPNGRLVGALAIEGVPRLIRIERDPAGDLVHVIRDSLRVTRLVEPRHRI